MKLRKGEFPQTIAFMKGLYGHVKPILIAKFEAVGDGTCRRIHRYLQPLLVMILNSPLEALLAEANTDWRLPHDGWHMIPLRNSYPERRGRLAREAMQTQCGKQTDDKTTPSLQQELNVGIHMERTPNGRGK